MGGGLIFAQSTRSDFSASLRMIELEDDLGRGFFNGAGGGRIRGGGVVPANIFTEKKSVEFVGTTGGKFDCYTRSDFSVCLRILAVGAAVTLESLRFFPGCPVSECGIAGVYVFLRRYGYPCGDQNVVELFKAREKRVGGNQPVFSSAIFPHLVLWGRFSGFYEFGNAGAESLARGRSG